MNNDATMKEKADALRNEQRLREQGSTFTSLTHSDEGGRYAKPQTVIGSSEPASQYTRGSAWTVDPVGQEPPLGSDVNFVEPCGTAVEVEQSIRKLGGEALSDSGTIGSLPLADAAVETKRSPPTSTDTDDWPPEAA